MDYKKRPNLFDLSKKLNEDNYNRYTREVIRKFARSFQDDLMKTRDCYSGSYKKIIQVGEANRENLVKEKEKSWINGY